MKINQTKNDGYCTADSLVKGDCFQCMYGGGVVNMIIDGYHAKPLGDGFPVLVVQLNDGHTNAFASGARVKKVEVEATVL